METVNAAASSSAEPKGSGFLYPLMLIAAIAVIVFSVVGIATMKGWMPRALSGADPAGRAAAAAPAKPAASRPRATAGAGPACSDCGVIESIRAVEVRGEGSGIGAIGGAGAGAYAGHQIEKTMNRSVTYQIRVRMNDGTTRTIHEPAQPALVNGQKVRVTERGLVGAG